MSALLLIALVSSGQATELAFDPLVDGLVLGASAAYYGAISWVDRPFLEPGAWKEPGNPLDAPFAGRPEDHGAIARSSDVLAYGSGVVAPLAMGVVAGRRGDARTGVDAALVGYEALTLSLVVNDVVKMSSRRLRPYTHSDAYRGELDAGAAPRLDDQLSFYSGHTSTSAAATFALAHALVLGEGWGAGGAAAAYGGAAGWTLATGALRVAAGKHYPTDVLVGGLAGAAIGVGVVEAHRGPISAAGLSRDTSRTMLTVGGSW